MSHVFVVDDDPSLGRLTSLILRSEGFEVQAFTSPIEALAEITDQATPQPVAVILDLNMPEMDGRDFYRRARAIGMTSPVVILSAYGAAAAREELGAEAAIAKPFIPELLIATLQDVLAARN